MLTDQIKLPSGTELDNTELATVNGATSELQTQIDSKLALAGGTLTGTLTLNADPSGVLEAATKQYADEKLAKTGGTLTGTLTLNADPSGALEAATKQYADLYKPLTLNAQSGTSYTLLLSDAGKYVRMSNAAANTMTVPPNSSVAFAVGTEVVVRQAGAGVTTVVEGAGVTVNTSGTLALAAQHDSVSIIKVGTDVWDLVGATA